MKGKTLPARLWEDHRGLVLLVPAMGLYFLVCLALGRPCPIHYLTGIACPGCGMTRAMLSLLRLDLEAAVTYHPLSVAVLPVAALWVWFGVKRWRRALYVLWGLAVVALVVTYILRFAFGDGTVVAFTPEEGAILRLIFRLRDMLS